MAASSSDMYNLSQDPTFQNRVMVIAVQQCIVVGQEDAKSIALHKERQAYAVGIENNPTIFKNQLAISIATDVGVIGDATANGTVVITTNNAAAQAALVSDIHIIGAFQGQFNTFFVN